uniref:Peptidase_M13 domain-containing protein n=1 Tax=Heligmosomoides polygyrus TaxID=6339 RepID=A0A183FWX1_HELPZ
LSNLTVLVGYPDKMDNHMAVESEAERISTELFWSMVFGAGAVYREKIKRLRKPVNPRDWVDSKPALSSTPIHNYERNLVQVPFDVARAPIADVETLDVLSYASVGSIIGHEVTHAFDDQGKLHGPTGNLGQHWWSSESRRRFSERESCYIEQYARLAGSDDDSESRSSLYENIADNVGLNVALKAWRTHSEDSFYRLPGLDLSRDQVFFVGYAQSWCALKSKQQRGVHMVEKTRVTGALQNSDEFSSAFSCPAGSPMNPKQKCVLW